MTRIYCDTHSNVKQINILSLQYTSAAKYNKCDPQK